MSQTLAITPLTEPSQRPYVRPVIPVLLMKNPGPIAGSGWQESKSRPPPCSSPVCLGQAGLRGGGGVWAQESIQWPVPGPRTLSPPLPPSALVWAVVGVTHPTSLAILFLPSESTAHSGEETQLPMSFPGVKPFCFLQAAFSHWPASSAKEAAIFLE